MGRKIVFQGEGSRRKDRLKGKKRNENLFSKVFSKKGKRNTTRKENYHQEKECWPPRPDRYLEGH